MRSPLLRLSLLGAAILALAAVEPAGAQEPRARPGQFEIHGLDFRPRGAWRQRVANIRAQRQALLSSGNIAQLNAAGPNLAGTVVAGSLNLPVVPVRFSNTDTTTLYAPAQYADVLFSPAPVGRPYSVKTYYEQLSNNHLEINGTVFPWVALPNTDVYYEDGCYGIGANGTSCPNGGARFGELLISALNAVSNRPDSLTVWAQYDNDGPDGVPNSGDDDGYVDFVTFLHPEVDGSCLTSNLWAHRYYVNAFTGGSDYVTKTARTGGGKIRVSDYIIQSGVGGNNSCTAGPIMPIGTVAHEIGHAFGLPDLYDTGGSTDGIGEWGLMGAGNWSVPTSPGRMEAWSMVELGWVAVDTLKSTGTITLRPVAYADTVLVLPTPTTGEYFLFENRAAVESDTAQMNPAACGGFCAKAPGLAVWHIDQGRISAGAFSNQVNTGTIQGVALVQADGLNQLRTAGMGNRGDTGDSYPGSTGNTVLDGTTNPALQTNAGLLVPGRIDSIRIDGSQNVLFRFRFEEWLRVAKFGTGSGTLTATVPGNLQQGVGVAPGTVVTLTAVPNTGHRFAGWTGDTTLTDSVLVVTMDRNWRLTAQFTYTAPFSTVVAANDLLGVPSLSVAQRTLLDQQGNNNGSYDLGDFLAWVTLSGQGVAPDLMARLIAAAGAPKGVAP